MEKELNLPTCLFGGPPDPRNVIKMGESQIGFMTMFARPLFEAVANVLPAMDFGVREMQANQKVWEWTIWREKKKQHPAFDEAGQPEDTRGGPEGDAEQERENLPPLPAERDSLLSSSRASQVADEPSRPWTEHRPRTYSEITSPAERRLRNTSMGSLSSARGHRKISAVRALVGHLASHLLINTTDPEGLQKMQPWRHWSNCNSVDSLAMTAKPSTLVGEGARMPP